MQSLNPFEIRASLKLNIINVIQGSEGLNPFEIRASLKPLLRIFKPLAWS